MILALVLAAPTCITPYTYQPSSHMCMANDPPRPIPATVDGHAVSCHVVSRYGAIVCYYDPKGGK